MSVTIDLPERLLAGVFHVPEPEVPRQVLIELACALYAREALTHAQAATLAGLGRFELGEELARREIPRHYSEDDLVADLTYGGGK
jgi:predicted HTH domain antitoxin